MLIYHPAYDAYHCVFRTLLLTNSLESIELQKLRILDFFLCFPSELSKVRLPRQHSEAKRLALELRNDYHGPISMNQAFRDMEHIQLAAFKSLAASSIVDQVKIEDGVIKRTGVALKEELKRKIDAVLERDSIVVEYIVNKLGVLPLNGSNGLKDRTGLMEYRYDVA
ncbi:MAG TPA: ABC-three component system middle component 5 [Sulfuricella sp.]|nr:ABC-three component system middle component 5 [Sulfuricella sp.]